MSSPDKLSSADHLQLTGREPTTVAMGLAALGIAAMFRRERGPNADTPDTQATTPELPPVDGTTPVAE